VEQTNYESKTADANGLGTTTRNRASKNTNNNSGQKDSSYYQGFIDRWLMQGLVRQIMLDEQINTDEVRQMRDMQQLTGVTKLPRVCKCMHCPIFTHGNVQVLKDIDNQLPHYGGLIVCGSVWVCPICATKISEGRKNELIQASDIWTQMGAENHSKAHVIFTIPHYHHQSLSYVRKKFMDTRRKLKEQKILKKRPELKVFSQIAAEYGLIGTVTAQEVTYGANGWHVHSHDLFFFNQQMDQQRLDAFKRDLVEAWIYAIGKTKLEYQCTIDEIRKNSIDATVAKSPEDYISKFGSQVCEDKKEILQKWGAAEELTKSHIKRAKNSSGKTPWDLLREIIKNPDDQKLYLRNAGLWLEYATVYKGKRQLFFSKNFRKTLGLEAEKTDQELAEADDKPAELIGALSIAQWKIIRRKKIREKILIMAVQEKWDKLCQYIENLKNK
jgi:hypothetical protein